MEKTNEKRQKQNLWKCLIKNLDKDIMNLCPEAVYEITGEMEEYFSGYEPWQIEKSFIIEENKRIICRTEENEKGKKEYTIDIIAMEDTLIYYYFKLTQDSLSLEKGYNDKGGLTSEKYEVRKETIGDSSVVKKMCSYTHNNQTLSCAECCDETEKSNDESFAQMCDQLKKKFKTYSKKI